MIVSIFAVLQLLAKTHVEGARDEKRNDDSCKNEIAHKVSLTMSEIRAAVLVKLRAKYVKKLLTLEK